MSIHSYSWQRSRSAFNVSLSSANLLATGDRENQATIGDQLSTNLPRLWVLCWPFIQNDPEPQGIYVALFAIALLVSAEFEEDFFAVQQKTNRRELV
jgi:hypothetical protein